MSPDSPAQPVDEAPPEQPIDDALEAVPDGHDGAKLARLNSRMVCKAATRLKSLRLWDVAAAPDGDEDDDGERTDARDPKKTRASVVRSGDHPHIQIVLRMRDGVNDAERACAALQARIDALEDGADAEVVSALYATLSRVRDEAATRLQQLARALDGATKWIDNQVKTDARLLVDAAKLRQSDQQHQEKIAAQLEIAKRTYNPPKNPLGGRKTATASLPAPRPAVSAAAALKARAEAVGVAAYPPESALAEKPVPEVAVMQRPERAEAESPLADYGF